MEISNQINDFKDLVNSYKITNIIITAKEIGIFNVLSRKKYP